MSSKTKTPGMPPYTVTHLPKVLMSILISSVTLWFLVTPYLVRPHNQFKADMAQLISNTSQPETMYWVENWTKWRLYLGEGEDMVTVYPHQQMSVQHMELSLEAVLEWRQ